ncbi:glycosyltransferase family 2 protein [Echinicola rosea]|uniref:Glycosyl transferase family 2 n=1 Tax=Echinicola rosea TaxID=1807691 RepID=A0ABQ1V874_9BACT|nr:glycosyltransferase family 2 protein [Echinicola rosea]GGF42941.1 glycosyl transferase family 2 [Echinicola rosea]
MKEAAIVILNYNGEGMLRRFLPNILANSFFDVIVADNNSNDGSVALMKTHFSAVKLISLSQNHGFSQGYNEVLEQLKGQYHYYILLNSDVEVSEKWDVQLIDWLRSHGDFAAVQPKILSQQDKSIFDYAGAGGGYIDRLGYPYCRGRVLGILEEDHGQYDDEVEVDWVSGACYGVRADVYHDLGGFEADFFAHMEEIDLCWRMARKGWKSGYLGKVQVYHVGGGTLSRTSPFKTYLNFRNNLLMLNRNLTRGGFLKIMVFRVLLDAAAALQFVLSGKSKHAGQVMKAYRDFFKMKNRADKRGALALKLPIQKASKEVASIVLSYYVMGRRKYPDL